MAGARDTAPPRHCKVSNSRHTFDFNIEIRANYSGPHNHNTRDFDQRRQVRRGTGLCPTHNTRIMANNKQGAAQPQVSNANATQASITNVHGVVAVKATVIDINPFDSTVEKNGVVKDVRKIGATMNATFPGYLKTGEEGEVSHLSFRTERWMEVLSKFNKKLAVIAADYKEREETPKDAIMVILLSGATLEFTRTHVSAGETVIADDGFELAYNHDAWATSFKSVTFDADALEYISEAYRKILFG